MSVFGIEIGNGWIFSLIYLAVSYVPMLFGGKAAKRLVDFSFASVMGKINSFVIMLLNLLLFAYPVFLKIQTGTIFYTGLGIFVLSAIAAITSFINYFSTPLDQTICKGMYRISRNPIYMSVTFMEFGMSLMCHSVIMAILLVVMLVLQHFIILEEEKFCMEKYGERYREFKQKVPRYLLFF